MIRSLSLTCPSCCPLLGVISNRNVFRAASWGGTRPPPTKTKTSPTPRRRAMGKAVTIGHCYIQLTRTPRHRSSRVLPFAETIPHPQLLNVSFFHFATGAAAQHWAVRHQELIRPYNPVSSTAAHHRSTDDLESLIGKNGTSRPCTGLHRAHFVA